MEPRKIRILGQPVHVIDLPAAEAYVAACIDGGKTQFVVAQNPEKVMRSLRDETLARAIDAKATLIVADGVGVVAAARLLGLGPIPRVPGIDLFRELLALASSRGKRVFLYGATPDVCRRAADVVERSYPGAVLAGAQHGYEADEALVVECIRRARPDFLFVALGTPQQEIWIAQHLEELSVPCVMGIGGSLDILAGEVRRAPRPMQRIGAEWLYRLLRQPSRARRMAVLPTFLWRVFRSR